MAKEKNEKDVVLRVRLGERYFVGPGKIRLLELVGEHGSISTAARNMKMSYRRAWLPIEGMNAAFKQPVVQSLSAANRAAVRRLHRSVLN